MFESCIEVGVWFGIEDVPHFGLTELVVLATSHFVTRVHLNGEVLMSIYDLGEERKLVVVTSCRLFAKDFGRTTSDDFGEVVACPGAVLYLGLGIGYARDCPVFGAPNEGLAVLLEEHRVELIA